MRDDRGVVKRRVNRVAERKPLRWRLVVVHCVLLFLFFMTPGPVFVCVCY